MNKLKAVFGHNHTHSIADIDYFAYNSNLYNINPYLKTAFFILALILCIGVNNIKVCVFTFFAMSGLTLFGGGINWHTYRKLLALPLTFILLSAITMVVDISGGIHISYQGIRAAVKLSVLAFSGVSCLYGLALSTPMADLIEVLKKVKIPLIIIELMFLIYRFIFVLSEVLSNMNKSAKCRNGFNGYRNSIKTYGMISRNLMLYSFNKTNKFYDAMTARKYNGQIAFYCDYNKVKFKHILYMAIYFGVVCVLCLI